MNIDDRMISEYKSLSQKLKKNNIPYRLKRIYLELEPKYDKTEICSALTKDYSSKDIAYMLLDLEYPVEDISKFLQEKEIRIMAYKSHLNKETKIKK